VSLKALYKRLGEKGMDGAEGLRRGWIVEAAYSTFKRRFGEFCMAKTSKA